MKLERIKKKNIFLLLLPALFFISFVFASEVNAITFNQQIPIPGVATSTIQPSGNTRAIGEYIKGVYNYGIGIVAILATVVMMFGGFQWIIAGGSAEKVGEAKAWIGASLTGLVLALSSYTILSMVNPNLTSLTVRKINAIKEIAPPDLLCCHTDGRGASIDKSCLIENPTICTEKCYEGDINCDNYCVGKLPSTACHGDGWCYNGRCYTGPGKLNEPCGIYTNTICSETCFSRIANTINPFVDTASGRSCDTDLWCCVE